MVLSVTGQKDPISEGVDALLNTAADARTRVDILLGKAKKLRNSQPQVALQHLQKAINLSRESGYNEGIAEALSNTSIARYNLAQYEDALADSSEALKVWEIIGNKDKQSAISITLAGICFRLGRYDKTLEALSTALNIKEDQNDQQGTASVLSNISNTYQAIGQYDIALENLLKALEIQEQINDKYGIAITANNIGGIYFRLGHTETALQYLNQALSWFRDGGNLYDTAKTLCNIGHMFGQLKKFDQAIEYQAEALSITKGIDDQQNLAATISSMGRTYAQTGQTATALSYFATALKIMRDIGDKQGEIEAFRYIGDIYYTKKDFKRSLRYYKQGIELSQSINAQSEEATLIESASRSLEALREYDTALAFYKKASEIRNEILASDKQKLIAVMEIRFNIERTSREREIYRLRNVELANAISALQEKSDALASAYSDLEQQQSIMAKINSDLEKANELLNLANFDKNELLGIVNHDVKNLVAGIKLSAEGIRRYKHTKDDSIMQQTAMRIIRASDEITHLTNSLLEHNALETGRIALVYTTVDVSSLLDDVIEHFTPSAESKNITFDLIYTQQDCTATADSARLKEVIANIVSNAVKYSPKGSAITLSTLTNDSSVIISVTDKGQGFTDKDKESLFQKFSRLSAKPTGNESSTGLGLSIAKKLIEMMGGKITLESTHTVGSTFTITIPKVASYESSAATG